MMKKLSLLSLFTLLPASYYFGQTTAYGYLKDANGNPLEHVEVDIKGATKGVKTDKIGYFQFIDLKEGNYQIVLSRPNFETKTLEFEVKDEKRLDLGTVTLYSNILGLEQGLTILDSSDEEGSGQSSTVGLLQSSRDVFSRIASFDLGFYWFRPRGIDGRKSQTFLNGAPMGKADDGNVNFNNWGGLNEITRYPEIAVNHSPSEYAFGGADGVVYKNTKASEYRKGFQFTQSFTNRNYRNRTSLRYSSGMGKSGWAFTIMGARRWAKEGIYEGTFYDAYGAYMGIEKRINSNRTLTLNVFASPSKRATSSPNTQEVYNYRGIFYNSYWGWHNGEKRSERVRENFMPIIQLQDFWKISDKTTLWTSVSYQFGKDKASRLDWQQTPNPSPTYYRNLPSYLADLDPTATIIPESGPLSTNQMAYQEMLNHWKNGNQQYTQLNWDLLYARNRQQPVGTYYGATGRRALYYLVNDVNDDKIWNVNTHLVHNFNDVTKFILNIGYQNYYSNQYREVKDLLGADFVLNRDHFAATNPRANGELYNVGEANVAKKVGDKMTYDYIFRRQEVRLNPALRFSTGAWDVFLSGQADYSISSREGLFRHYLYPNAYGKGKEYTFWNFGMKGQITRRINGRNFIVYNGGVFSVAPVLDNLFINPRLNGSVVPNIKSTFFVANDLSYVLNAPKAKIRLTGYWVDTQNGTNTSRFFADGINIETINEQGEVTPTQSAFVTQVLTDVQKRNIGLELGVSYKLTPSLEFQGLANLGQYTYRNNPNVYFAADAMGATDNGSSFVELGKAYLKNYRQGGTPQQAFSAGLRYSSPKFWWIGANWNYLANNYLDPSAIIRTERFIQNGNIGTPYAGANEETLRRLLAQRQLPSAHFLNINAGKSWLLGKYYFLISATVNNVLNNTNFITGGFEQIRNANLPSFQQESERQHPLFAPKYWYGQGRSYFINLQFRF